jgi:hypothetical protein
LLKTELLDLESGNGCGWRLSTPNKHHQNKNKYAPDLVHPCAQRTLESISSKVNEQLVRI